MRQDVFRRISMYLNIAKLLNSLVEAMPFHAVDRGSNPLGDANKRSSVERAFESKFCAFFLFDRLPFSKAFSAAAEQPGRGVLSPSRCVRGLTDPPPPNTFGGQALPVNVYPPLSTATPASRQPPALRFRVLRMRLQSTCRTCVCSCPAPNHHSRHIESKKAINM